MVSDPGVGQGLGRRQLEAARPHPVESGPLGDQGAEGVVGAHQPDDAGTGQQLPQLPGAGGQDHGFASWGDGGRVGVGSRAATASLRVRGTAPASRAAATMAVRSPSSRSTSASDRLMGLVPA